MLKWNEWVHWSHTNSSQAFSNRTLYVPICVCHLGEKKFANREYTVVVEPSGEAVRWRGFRLFFVQWRHDAIQKTQHLLQKQMGESVFIAILWVSIYRAFLWFGHMWIFMGVWVFCSVFKLAWKHTNLLPIWLKAPEHFSDGKDRKANHIFFMQCFIK